MSEAVTYADLKFGDIVMKETDLSVNGDDGDDGNDYGDIMYENVETLTPSRFRDLSDPPDHSSDERKDSLLSRYGTSLLVTSLLLLLLLSATTIGMSVKYMSESQELQRLSKRFAQMNDSLSQRLQSKEDLLSTTKNELETTQRDLEQLVRGMSTLNATLHQCAGDRDNVTAQKEKAVQDQQTAERSLNESRLRVTKMEKDLCPENWIMIGKKCLLINEDQKGWYDCERKCLEMSANLLVIRKQDEPLKKFLANKEDYWLGKEIQWTNQRNQWKAEWRNPAAYGVPWSCVKISNGEYTKDDCWTLTKCICERDILLVKYSKVYSSSPKLPGFDMQGTDYYCTKNK